MTLLIDTSDMKVVKVCLEEEGKLIDQLIEENQFGSQALLPLIKKLLKQNNIDFKDLTSIVVSEGPGSYTGLRVGASVAQALGLGLNIPVNGKINKPIELKYT